MENERERARLRKAAKRRRRALWLMLLAALALSAALYLLLPAVKRFYPSERRTVAVGPVPTATTVATLPADALSEIVVKQAEGESYALLLRDGALYLQTGDGERAISEDISKRMISAVSDVVMMETVAQSADEVSEHLADMGLTPPRITVTARRQDGSETTLSFGAAFADTGMYYCLWSGDGRVYLCDASLYQTFEYTAGMLLPVEQPQLRQALIDRVTITKRDGETLAMRLTTDADGAVSGTLEAPLPYPMDSAAATRIVTALGSFALGSVQPALTEESAAAYGFDDPLAIVEAHQKAGSYADVTAEGQLVSREAPEATVRLVFGRSEGDFFYTCLYDGACYYVSSFLVAGLLSANADALRLRAPADMGDAVVTAVDIRRGDSAYALRYERVERVLPNNQLETDENGNVVYDATATCNGESYGVEAYLALVERLKGMSVTGALDSGFTLPDTAPRWEITLSTQGGGRRVVTAYPLDTFSDAIAVDGVACYAMNGEALEIALQGLFDPA